MRKSSPVRAVVDINVLFSGLISKSDAPFEILEMWRATRLRLLVSEEIFAGYQRVLARPAFVTRFAFSEADVQAIVSQFRQEERVVVDASFQIPVTCRDPKDQISLTAAVAAAVPYLISGHDDLLACAGDPGLEGVRIVRPGEFLERLDRQGEFE